MTTLRVSELQRGDQISVGDQRATVRASHFRGAQTVVIVRYEDETFDRLSFPSNRSVTFHPGALSEY